MASITFAILAAVLVAMSQQRASIDHTSMIMVFRPYGQWVDDSGDLTCVLLSQELQVI